MRVAGEGSDLLLCLLLSVENGTITLKVSDTPGDYSSAEATHYFGINSQE